MFTTLYRRKPGAKKDFYQTKSHTDYHAFLRASHEGKTYEGGVVYTHFCEGLPLDEPFMSGGKRVHCSE